MSLGSKPSAADSHKDTMTFAIYSLVAEFVAKHHNNALAVMQLQHRAIASLHMRPRSPVLSQLHCRPGPNSCSHGLISIFERVTSVHQIPSFNYVSHGSAAKCTYVNARHCSGHTMHLRQDARPAKQVMSLMEDAAWIMLKSRSPSRAL